MRKVPLVLAVAVSVAILALSGAASARLVVFGPETMVDHAADAIVVAKVVS